MKSNANVAQFVVIGSFFVALFLGTVYGWFPSAWFYLLLVLSPVLLVFFYSVSRKSIQLPKAPSTFVAIKMGHLAAGLLTVAFLVILGKNAMLVLYSSFATASLTYLYLRWVRNLAVPAISSMFEALFGTEKAGDTIILGPYLGILGIIPVLAFFNEHTALLSILCFAVFDPTAAVLGHLIGKRQWFFNHKKTVEGSIAGLIASFIVLFPFVGFTTSLLTSLIVSGAEAIKSPVADNVYLPSVAAASLFLIA